VKTAALMQHCSFAKLHHNYCGK